MKTLVIFPNWVGDTVMAQPAIESLVDSGREIHAFTRESLHPLVGLMPGIAGILAPGTSDAESTRVIRKLGAEEVMILPNSFRSAWWAWRAGIPRRWGYAGDFRRPLLRPAVRRPRSPRAKGAHRHQLNDYDRLLEAMGLEPVGTRRPRLEPSAEHRETARRVFEDHGCGAAGKRLVGLFPGGAFGPSKRWPAGRFAAVARELAVAHATHDVVVIAGPGEEEIARSISHDPGRPLPVVGPDLDLAELAAALGRLSLLITNDSGPMHLAAAVGTPCLALFGPTDPRRTAPLGPDHRVLSTSRWCSPCFRRRCPLLHHRCLRDIRVEDVVRAAGAENYSIS